MTITKALLAIIERPKVPQPYRDLAKALAADRRPEEAAAVEHLLEVRFPSADSPRPNA
jgi:hypothetical protein